jgi:ABC-type glycerol-3-phosphate transport system substrate-binding protein
MKTAPAILILVVILTIVAGAYLALPREAVRELIVLHHWSDKELEFYEPIIDEFENMHGVEVKLWAIPFGSEVDKVYGMKIAGKKLDVIRMDIAKPIDMYEKGYLANLNEITGKSTEELISEFLEVTAKMDVFENEVFALPETIDCAVVFYNKEIFDRYFDEFENLARQLTHPDDGVWGYGQRNTLWWDAPWIFGFGGVITDNLDPPTTCLINNENTLQALQRQVNMIEEGISPKDFDAESGFKITRKFAMVLWGPWAIEEVKKAGIDLGAAPIPRGPAGSISLIGGQHLGVYKHSENKKLAYEFIRFLLRKEVQLQRFQQLGVIPTMTEVYENVKTLGFPKDPIREIVLEQLATALPRVKVMKYAAMEKIYSDEIELARKGILSLEEQLAKVQGRINTEIFGAG